MVLETVVNKKSVVKAQAPLAIGGWRAGVGTRAHRTRQLDCLSLSAPSGCKSAAGRALVLASLPLLLLTIGSVPLLRSLPGFAVFCAHAVMLPLDGGWVGGWVWVVGWVQHV